MVALHTGTLEAVDACIESGLVGHALIDVVVAVVVNLSLHITDDGMNAPDVVVLAAIAVTENARSISLGNTSQGDSELCGVVGEQQVTAVSSKGFQRLDGCRAGKASGQLVPAFANTDAVAHYPTHGVLLDVEVVDGCGSKKHSLTSIHISILKPCYGVGLVGRSGIVIRNEHGYLLISRCSHILQTVGCELLQLVLFFVGIADAPLVGCKAHGEDATSKGGGGVEVDNTGAAVVNDVVPRTEDGRVGSLLPCLHHIGVGSQTVGVEVPHAVVVALHTGTLEAVDACIESGLVGHALIDVVVAVVVNLSLHITDDGMNAPDVVVLAAIAVTENARSISLGNTSQGDSELCGVVGEQQVTAVGSKGFQGLNGGCAGKAAG